MVVIICDININMLVPIPTHKYTTNHPHQDNLYTNKNSGLWHKAIFSISLPSKKNTL